MFEIASQIVLCLVLAALLGAIIGYILGKASCGSGEDCQNKTDTSHELHIAHHNDSASKVQEVQPLLLSQPREEGKDNLQLIKGIGEIIEKTLNDKGVYHFDQIANWTVEEVAWIDRVLAFPGRASRENWIEQAKNLVSGESN